jgi:hypothetical protein
VSPLLKNLDNNVIKKLDKKFGSGLADKIITHLNNNLDQTKKMAVTQEQIDDAQEWRED